MYSFWTMLSILKYSLLQSISACAHDAIHELSGRKGKENIYYIYKVYKLDVKKLLLFGVFVIFLRTEETSKATLLLFGSRLLRLR